MDIFNRTGEISEAPESKSGEEVKLSKKSLDKFDQIMGDDKVEVEAPESVESKLGDTDRESKFDKLFATGDFFEKTEGDHISQKREPNSKYELDGDIYETDDNGNTYKKNGELLPNTEYTVNGNTYRTNEHGNKISCDALPTYTSEGSRKIKEQMEAGGDERQQEDDGGHMIARILGGAEGDENLVPMRRTINRGDYKKMENEIANALQEGKEVTVHIDLEYDGDSQRPSKIRVEYTIDGKKTVVDFDNEKNSTDLLDALDEKISDEDCDNLKIEIENMKEDGIEASVTSVKVEYDENDNPTKITVGVLDESTGKKTYKVYEPRQEA